MSGLDIFILINMCFNAYRGLNHGLIKTITNLVGWFVALVCAVLFHEQVAPLMVVFSLEVKIQKVIAFAGIVFSVMLMSWAVNYLFSGIFKTLKLNWLNRIAGAVFGVAKTAIVAMILIYILSPWLSGMAFWKNSMVIQLLAPHSDETAQYSQQVIKKSADALEKQRLKQKNAEENAIISHRQSQQERGQSKQSEQPSSSKVANPFQ